MNRTSVAICIPAFNEEKNIRRILSALLVQKTDRVYINKIVVVSSASIDTTEEIVREFCQRDYRVRLIIEKERNGKAAAINSFLKIADEEIIVLESADTVPKFDTIEKLCLPLITDEKIGLTGGAPIPVDDKNTFLGYIIHAWWWFHRNIPRFGEIIAYRNVLKNISPTTAVDEAYIQAKIVQKGYKCVLIDTAVVYNKGAENIKDIIKQRRRVFNGHARLFEEEGVKIDNMTKSSIWLLLFVYRFNNLKELVWFLGGIGIEIYARFLGFYDMKFTNENPFIWKIAKSTKNVNIDYL